MLIQTILEAIIAAILIVGIFNEQKIAEFEQHIISKILQSRKKQGANHK